MVMVEALLNEEGSITNLIEDCNGALVQFGNFFFFGKFFWKIHDSMREITSSSIIYPKYILS